MNELESFWEQRHLDKDKRLLSGCLFDETVDFLNVRNNLSPNINILEVGVGLGYVTESLSKIGKVSAIDISESALDRVKPVCQQIFKSEDTHLLPNNFYDLIICHNVVQHIPTTELKKELTDIIQSLTTNGVFALEFVSNDIDDTGGDNYNIKDAQFGWLFRNLKFMENMVKECGGVSQCMYDGISTKKNNIKVYVLHIRKI